MPSSCPFDCRYPSPYGVRLCMHTVLTIRPWDPSHRGQQHLRFKVAEVIKRGLHIPEVRERSLRLTGRVPAKAMEDLSRAAHEWGRFVFDGPELIVFEILGVDEIGIPLCLADGIEGWYFPRRNAD